MNKESEQHPTIDHDKPEIMSDYGRQSSQHASFRRSISHGSSGVGNSSRHSFSFSFGLPTGINIKETEDAEPEMETPSQQAHEVPLRRLAYLNKPEIPVLLLGVIAAVVNGVILPIFGILLSSIVKTFYEPESRLRKDAKFWSLMFVILGFVSFVASPIRTYFFGVAGCRLIKRIRLMSFQKVVNMEIGWFDNVENSSGAIGARLSADAASVRSLIGDALALLVQNAASAIAGLAIAFEANWRLALIILALVPVIGINGWIQMKFIKGFSADSKVCF